MPRLQMEKRASHNAGRGRRTSGAPVVRQAPATPRLTLQRAVGNSAYGRFVQPKLVVGAPGDHFEQEADRVADAVVGALAPIRAGASSGAAPVSVQRACAECEEEERLQRSPAAEGQGPADEDLGLDGQEEEDEETGAFPVVQRALGGAAYASPALAARISSTQGRGEPLPEATQRDLGSRMAADFGAVRVHHDQVAARMCSDLNAHAFTLGRDIYFNTGRYDPESAAGTHLLAHELTHTIQQTAAIRRLSITPTKAFTQGKCGERSVYWNFESGVAAPKSGGYIVQHVRSLENIKDCPAEKIGSISIAPKEQFWEAWWVAPGDKIQEIHKNGQVDFTDRSARSAKMGENKSGLQVSLGTVKFFGRDTTGDLGKEDVLSSDAAIASDWKPGTKGGVPQAGWLPSTRSEPSWWGSPMDGPASRWANSWWSCCGGSEQALERE